MVQETSYTKLHDLYEAIHGLSPELLTAITLGSQYYLLLLYTQ